MAVSKESQNDPRAELFDPDEDCSTDESVGGAPGGRCALIPEEQCTLRCYVRHAEGEAQLNDALVDTRPLPSERVEHMTPDHNLFRCQHPACRRDALAAQGGGDTAPTGGHWPGPDHSPGAANVLPGITCTIPGHCDGDNAPSSSGVEYRCPGGAEYGHGLTAKTVHGSGCCDKFARLSASEQAATGLRYPAAVPKSGEQS